MNGDGRIKENNNQVLFGDLTTYLFCLVISIWAHTVRPVVDAWLKTVFTMTKFGFAIPISLLVMIGFFKAAMNRFKVKTMAFR